MKRIGCDYTISKDISFFMEAENINSSDLAKKIKVSRRAIDELLNSDVIKDEVCDKLYSFFYKKKYRINLIKEELLKERYENVLFSGLKDKHDFGDGSYLVDNYNQVLSSVNTIDNSSVCSFKYSLNGLRIKEFKCNLEWVLSICFYRGYIDEYKNHELIKRLVKEVEEADVVIAPASNNRILHIMNRFADGEINIDTVLNCLSAFNLGREYVFKSDRAIAKLESIERYYLCILEKEDSKLKNSELSFQMDTQLKIMQREYRTGMYVEEVLK